MKQKEKWGIGIFAVVTIAFFGAISGSLHNKVVEGDTLYIYKKGAHSTQNMYQKYSLKELEAIKDNVPSGVETISVAWRCDFEDGRYTYEELPVYTTSIAVSDLKAMNWGAVYDDAAMASETMAVGYVRDGLK